MKTAEEALKIYLGGNMNTCTLKPLAIIEIMETYAREVAEAQRAADQKEIKDYFGMEKHSVIGYINQVPLVTSPNTGDKK